MLFGAGTDSQMLCGQMGADALGVVAGGHFKENELPAQHVLMGLQMYREEVDSLEKLNPQ